MIGLILVAIPPLLVFGVATFVWTCYKTQRLDKLIMLDSIVALVLIVHVFILFYSHTN